MKQTHVEDAAFDADMARGGARTVSVTVLRALLAGPLARGRATLCACAIISHTEIFDTKLS